jgi:hypothetical protein
MESFDLLPLHLRRFISDLNFNLADKHILLGEEEILRVKGLIESGVTPTYKWNGKN